MESPFVVILRLFTHEKGWVSLFSSCVSHFSPVRFLACAAILLPEIHGNAAVCLLVPFAFLSDFARVVG